jgi:hypothetical protein
MISDDFWPRSVAHLARPYDDGISEYVVIALINDESLGGYEGYTELTTALIPLGVVDEVLASRGSIGHEVSTWGPHPCVADGQIYETSFWIEGRAKSDERFQTLLNSWRHHNQTVVLPDSVFLMTYGLIPRYLEGGTVSWDDPGKPVYDVVRAKSHYDAAHKRGRPLIEVSVRRGYLEDYCSLKGAAAVVVYYEERFDIGDSSHAAALNGIEGDQFELPGRLLGIATLNGPYHQAAPQMSRVWGARLLLKPNGRPISDPIEKILEWPDHQGPMTFDRAAGLWLYAHVKDEVLQEYEARPEFAIQPESGGVSYGGWWGTSRTSRFGRSFIRVELKSFYEGCPSHVIEHWHRFAFPEAVAKHDRASFGDRNIADRAGDFVNAYLGLTEALLALSDSAGLGFSQSDIGGLDSEDVRANGWWRTDGARAIFACAPMHATVDQFLSRAMALFQFLENLQPSALRSIALSLGLTKEQLKGFGSVKLFGTICQLFTIAARDGYELPADASFVASRWDTNLLLPALAPVFALQSLRIIHGHAAGPEKDSKINLACAALGIDPLSTAGGWGLAIDALIDSVTTSLNDIAKLVGTVDTD